MINIILDFFILFYQTLEWMLQLIVYEVHQLGVLAICDKVITNNQLHDCLVWNRECNILHPWHHIYTYTAVCLRWTLEGSTRGWYNRETPFRGLMVGPRDQLNNLEAIPVSIAKMGCPVRAAALGWWLCVAEVIDISSRWILRLNWLYSLVNLYF